MSNYPSLIEGLVEHIDENLIRAEVRKHAPVYRLIIQGVAYFVETDEVGPCAHTDDTGRRFGKLPLKSVIARLKPGMRVQAGILRKKGRWHIVWLEGNSVTIDPVQARHIWWPLLALLVLGIPLTLRIQEYGMDFFLDTRLWYMLLNIILIFGTLISAAALIIGLNRLCHIGWIKAVVARQLNQEKHP